MRKSGKKRNIKETVKDTVETIVKPVVKPVSGFKDTVETIVKPVTGLIDVFNFVMKKVEEKVPGRKEDVEIDGFVSVLLDEMKDVEQGIFAFFSEMLFMQHLSEKMAQVENEVTLVSILAERVKEFLKPGFIEVFLCGGDKTSFQLAYHYPSIEEFNPAGVKDIAMECFNKGESSIFNNRKVGGKSFSVLTAPLRTTRDKFGTVVVGRRGKSSLSSKDITLVIAGATVVSFSMSNIKLVNSMIKNKRLAAIGETIGGLSHDIKNILTSLESGIAIMDIALGKNDAPKLQDRCLCSKCKLSSECMEDFKMLTEGIKATKNGYERMKELVLSMVDYSKDREISLSSVNLNKLIKDFLDIKREDIRDRKIKLIENFDGRVKEIEADPLRIERMIGNLLNNAIDAVKGKAGVVKTGTKLSADRKNVILWVEDNGCGIPEENLGKIFDVFYSTKGSKGTGFGLAIVQKVVREHGGTIEVKSVVNKGTKFLIKIPVRK